MRRSILLSLLLLLPASFAAAESVKLGTKAPSVGDKWTEEKKSNVTATVTVQGKSFPVAMNEEEKKKIEVLAMKGDIVSKAKVTYDKKAKTQTGPGAKAGPSAIEGKTYTLTAGDPITVEPSGEADEVRKAEKRFGKVDRLRAAVGGKEYTKGKPVEIKADDARQMFGDNPDLEIQKFTLEYLGMSGKNAKFSLVAAMKSKERGQNILIEMKGTAIVDPTTSDPVEMDLSGTMKQDDPNMKIDGTMTMSARRSK